MFLCFIFRAFGWKFESFLYFFFKLFLVISLVLFPINFELSIWDVDFGWQIKESVPGSPYFVLSISVEGAPFPMWALAVQFFLPFGLLFPVW